MKNFDARQAARAAGMDDLNEAKAILSGMKPRPMTSSTRPFLLLNSNLVEYKSIVNPPLQLQCQTGLLTNDAERADYTG